MTPSPWIVLKFGGTSVSSLPNWTNIANVAAERLADGARVLIVHSAVAGVTDRLERLLDAAKGKAQEEELRAIEERHRRLATELGVTPGEELERYLAELREIAAGVSLVGEVSDRTRARVLASGELMATALGARFLAARRLPVQWVDARTMLRAESRGASPKASVLSALCGFAPDAALQARLAAGPALAITQGFIASDEEGNTVLLGPRRLGHLRGVSRRQAARPRGWRSGPTCPACSAPTRAPRRPRGCCARCTTTRPRRSPPAAPRCCTRAASCRCGSTAFRCTSMPHRRRTSRARCSAPTAATAARR